VVGGVIATSAAAVSIGLLHGDVGLSGVIASRAERALQVETAEGGNPAYTGFRRTSYWSASAQMAAQRPLTGVGIGNFGPAALAVNPRLVPKAGSYGAFSGWLGEFGIPGLLVFLTLVVVLLRTLRRAYVAGSEGQPELLGFLAASVGIIVQYLFSGYWRLDPFTWAFFGLAMAGVVAQVRQSGRSLVPEAL
jgi:O-antigen ligase